MRDLRQDFVKEHEGAWVCIMPTELVLPSGRIQVAAGTRFTPGTRFMGVDVARLLEDGTTTLNF